MYPLYLSLCYVAPLYLNATVMADSLPLSLSLSLSLSVSLFDSHWNFFTFAALTLSALSYFFWLTIETMWQDFQPDLYNVWFYTMRATSLFFVWLVIVSLCLIPNYCID
eukprot:TRINITY_DN2483_c1_g1_i6.p2 TRINITY_DN2483_c1_g1~~TRINITY_DN2483_c1_g1_i6.p2  ORF type:complete len:109 (+),score=33.31 TRINITY_DN2483_c1_g1_i6:618-944(+)